MPIHLAWGAPENLVWETPFSTGIQGQIASPLPLPDGRLLLFYVHRHSEGSPRLVLSRDQGRTWELDGEVVIYTSEDSWERGRGIGVDQDDFWETMSRWSVWASSDGPAERRPYPSCLLCRPE